MTFLILILALLQASAATGSISGVVQRAGPVPAEALSGARVELRGGFEGALVTRTDERGEFSFSGLPPGRYRVFVQKEGYVRQEYGERSLGSAGSNIAIQAGTRVQGLGFQLQPAATVAGRVRNEDGIPVANILMQALRRTYDPRGKRTISVFASTLTDDLGAYRLYWLDPGEYYVSSSYLPQLPTLVNANEEAPRTGYAPTYYPGFSDSLNAGLLRLESDRPLAGIDFKLERAPLVKVRGTIYSILSRAAVPAMVVLTAVEESGSTARYSIQTDSAGAFEMKGVTPGTYVLSGKSLSGDGQTGFATIKVAPVDYPKADVIVGPGMPVTVRLFSQPGTTPDVRSTQVSLLPLEPYLPFPGPATMQSNGTFMISNVQPGDYLLTWFGLPEDAYVRAARSGSRNLLEEFVEVRYDNASPLDVQIAFDGGQISGVFSDAESKPVAGGSIVVVPDTERRQRVDQYRVAVSAQDGSFSIRGIPPGGYKLFAWEVLEPNAYLNAEYIAHYEELGVPVQIAPGSKAQVQVRPLSAPAR